MSVPAAGIQIRAGDAFKTVYGTAIVKSTRAVDGICEARLDNWFLANGAIPKIYLPLSSVKYEYSVGDIVNTAYGTGTLTDVRADGMHLVQPNGWLLANDKPPVFYMPRDAISLSIRRTDSPKWVYATGIARCIACKNEAASNFKAGDVRNAMLKYFESLHSMERLGENLTNDQKAEVFELTVLINNNLSRCAYKLDDCGEAVTYALNSARLVDALVMKVGDSSLVFESLRKRNSAITDVNAMQKLWKRQSLYLAGMAEKKRKNFAEAIIHLEEAKKIVTGDPAYAKEENDTRIALAEANAGKKSVKEKEKKMYQKAFSSEANDSDTVDVTVKEMNVSDKARSTKNQTSVGVMSNSSGNKDDDEDWVLLSALALGGITLIGVGLFMWMRRRK